MISLSEKNWNSEGHKLFCLQKEWSSVLRDCSSALELQPRYTKALARRARAAETLKDLDLALEDYTAICIIEAFGNQESLAVVDKLLKQIGKVVMQFLCILWFLPVV